MDETSATGGWPRTATGSAAGAERTPAPGWKHALRAHFEEWLAAADGDGGGDRDGPGGGGGEPGPEGANPGEMPDLYTFFETLTALRAELRAGNRKAAGAFGRFGEVLEDFDKTLGDLRAKAAEQEAERDLPTEVCLSLVESFERLDRLAEAAAERPAAGPIRPGQRFLKAWDGLASGIDIVRGQLAATLAAHGIRRLEVVGLPFDRRTMVAAAVEEAGGGVGRRAREADAAREADGGGVALVVAEVSPGFTCGPRVVRPARVSVSAPPPPDKPHSPSPQ